MERGCCIFRMKTGEEGACLAVCVCAAFGAKKVFAHSGTPDASDLCTIARKMWDLHDLHVPHHLRQLRKPGGCKIISMGGAVK